MLVVTTYKCWNCYSEETITEEIEPFHDSTWTTLEEWNLCPECIKKAKEDRQ